LGDDVFSNEEKRGVVMNQVFNFKRYVWLVKRQWFENATIYKWGILLMVLVVGFLFWFSGDWNHVSKPQLAQEQTFIITGMLFMYIYGAWFFESLSSKRKKMFYFSLPVSPLERVLVAFTFVMVFMPALMLSIYTIFDFVFLQIFNHIHGITTQMLFKIPYPVGPMGFLLISLFCFLSTSSIFTLGSLLFGKKGPILSILFYIVSLCIYVLVLRWFFRGRYLTYAPILLINYIHICFIPIYWVMMYFVMKKKEA
jgi:hypothetical protein